jgi:Flp pilus assembly protein TadG
MRAPKNAVVLPDIPLTGSTTVNRRDQGATAVEFAIVLPVVLAVMFFGLYGAMYVFYGAVADHVARSVSREVSIPMQETGSGYPDQATNGGEGTVNAYAKNAAGTLLPNPTCVVSTWNSNAQPTSAPCANSQPAGTPQEGDLVTVWVTYKLPVLDELASMIPGMSSIDSITRSATERRQ